MCDLLLFVPEGVRLVGKIVIVAVTKLCVRRPALTDL